MIRKICEIHLQVASLDRGIEFYSRLGMRKTGDETKRRIAFFNMEETDQPPQMLGLWENPGDKPIDVRHVAFEVGYDDILAAKEWLHAKGIETWPVFGRDGLEPIVHVNSPAASVYFKDPDGNELEFYCRLQGPTKRKYTRTPTLSEWEHDQRKLSLE